MPPKHRRPPPLLAPVAFPDSKALATELKFGALCDLLDRAKAAKAGKRREIIRKFFERAVTGRRFENRECVAGGPDVTTPVDRLGDVYQLFRLILPNRDTVRPMYQVSEKERERRHVVSLTFSQVARRARCVFLSLNLFPPLLFL